MSKPNAKEMIAWFQGHISYIAGLFTWAFVLIAGIAIAWVLLGTALRAARIGIIPAPSIGITEFAYLCGAWALYLWKR